MQCLKCWATQGELGRICGDPWARCNAPGGPDVPVAAHVRMSPASALCSRTESSNSCSPNLCVAASRRERLRGRGHAIPTCIGHSGPVVLPPVLSPNGCECAALCPLTGCCVAPCCHG
eukprot:scaffold213834_cov20-Tisochrysis_lutea.AAC.1